MWTRRTLVASAAASLLAQSAAGAEGYVAALSRAYGAPVEALAAHGLARREAARLTRQADALLRGQGLRHGSVGDRLWAFATDERWLYPDDDAGRARAVADMNARLAALRPRLAAVFDGPIPQAQVFRPTEANEGRGGYREPPAYYVDLRKIRDRPAWTLPSVAFHETVPGHALIGSGTAGRLAPAFSEAWSIYAEQLAFDLGAYGGDPRGELGYMHWRLFRMARIIVDTGQGALGWSEQQAREAMQGLQGFPIAFTTIGADVGRMRVQPGAYAAQGLGALAIARARPRRRAEWPAFHRAILADGLPPFAMLVGA